MGQKIADRPGAKKAFKASSALLRKLKNLCISNTRIYFFLKLQFRPLGNAASKANINEMELQI
jgi:hypothetical protein